MKIFWLIIGLPPAACEQCGYGIPVHGTWIQNSIDCIKALEENIRLTVCCVDGRPCDCCIDGVRYVSVPYKKYSVLSSDDAYKMFERRVRKLIQDENSDIIHIHGNEHIGGCLDPSTYCGKPVVVSVHGILSACHIHLTGGISPREFLRDMLNAQLALRLKTPFGVQTFWRTKRVEVEKAVFKQTKYFIGRTKWDSDCVRALQPDACYFQVNETLRPLFYSHKRELSKVVSRTIYCGAAASYPLKGAHWLLQAVSLLKSDYPEIQLRIAAAEGALRARESFYSRLKSSAYNSYLLRMIRNMGIEDNVVLLQTLGENEVCMELSRAELFVLPSLCENSPNSLAEAMLMGTPAIATYVGGIPSMLQDGKDGILLPPYDPYALAGAIRYAFEHPAEMMKMAEHAKNSATLRHDGIRNAHKLIEVYKEIIT